MTTTTGAQARRNDCLLLPTILLLLVDDVMHAILPEDIEEGAPSGFAVVGHVGTFSCAVSRFGGSHDGAAHMNLRPEYLPYKHIIGQVVLDVSFRCMNECSDTDGLDRKIHP